MKKDSKRINNLNNRISKKMTERLMLIWKSLRKKRMKKNNKEDLPIGKINREVRAI